GIRGGHVTGVQTCALPISTPFKDAAEKDLARLKGIPLQKTNTVDNIRYWEATNSVRVVVDVAGDITFTQGDAKDPDRVFIDVSQIGRASCRERVYVYVIEV